MRLTETGKKYVVEIIIQNNGRIGGLGVNHVVKESRNVDEGTSNMMVVTLQNVQQIIIEQSQSIQKEFKQEKKETETTLKS